MDIAVIISSHVGWLLLGRFNTTSLFFVGGKKLSINSSQTSQLDLGLLYLDLDLLL